MTTIPLTETHVLVNRKAILGLLEYIRFEDQWMDRMRKVGVEIDPGPKAPCLINCVLDLIGFPKEGEGGFSRDYLALPEQDLYERPSDYLDWLFKEKAEVDNITGSN